MRNALKLSVDGTLTNLDLDAPEGSLAVLQAAVGGYIEPADLTRHVTMYFNEEGKLGGFEPNNTASWIYTQNMGWADVIMGDVVFTGGVDDEGDTKGLPEDLEVALRNIVKQIG